MDWLKITDIHGPQFMNYKHFGDALLPLAQSSGQNFILTNTLVYDQIFARLMTFL